MQCKSDKDLDLHQVTAVKFVQTDDFSAFHRLCSFPDFKPLRGLVAVMCWDHCTDLAAASKLVDHIHISKVQMKKL